LYIIGIDQQAQL